ncbi:CHASE domain-containing protein [Lysobacter sp. N42]|uniref:CHASE domain-containing protein n=1 Tax=Lysobacter sp. N42 TaxID=2545719 RepID=UPI00104D2526|nr:CHASE domain-containing protein [Lysobacter sp. N42]TCZ88377.1 PAS domain S-box protein [Lysobacter sp. N42]
MPTAASVRGWSARLLPRGSQVFAFIILVASVVLVLTMWSNAREREIEAARGEFAAQANEVTELLRQRLAQYELVTRGGVSLFASVARPTPRQWQAYVDGMQLEQRFPAVLGLGFAGYVAASDLPRLQLEWRESGYGLLNVRPHGRRAYYGPILYLEPRRPENVAAVGFDMYSEPTRREAMEAALVSGEPRLSGPVQLVQDGEARRIGALLYLPIYRAGDAPSNEAARRASAQGWIYVPFRVGVHVEDAARTHLRHLRLRIDDVTASARPLYEGGIDAQDAAFVEERNLEAYGRTWRLHFASPPLAQAAPDLAALRGLLALGLVAALLLYGVAFSLARTGTRARRIAAELTEDYRRSEQRFRSAMEYSAIGKVLLDSNGRIVEANPAFARTVGRPAAHLVGVAFESLFDDIESAERGEIEAGGVWRRMRRLQRDDGSVRHVHVTYSPVPGNIGQDITGLAQMEDVTERMLAEARVHALNRTLEARVALRTRELMRANQELETFAYSVSHDLRAPLRAIDGFSRILAERYGERLDEAGRGYLARVRRAAARMGELIDSMLQLSRLTRSPLKVERVDLTRMAHELVEELQAGDPARRVEVEIEQGLVVDGDATLLRGLLGNLLGNAWKFTRERDPARIQFGRNAAGEFYVRDNGAGFAQEYVDKLFRPFQRLHNEEHFTGHGIGLATVHRIVERHGGTIRAEGRVEEGATFYFTLPGPAEG